MRAAALRLIPGGAKPCQPSRRGAAGCRRFGGQENTGGGRARRFTGRVLESDEIDLDVLTMSADRELELDALRHRMGLILDAIADGVLTLDLHGCVDVANPAACALLGVEEEDLRGTDAERLLGRLPAGARPDLTALADTTDRYEATERINRADGTSFPAELTVSPITNAGVTLGAVIVFRDISSRMAATERLKWMATHDPVTGLLNRNGFEPKLASALVGGRRSDADAALLFCDLDRFKAVNDTYGHEAGDEVLKAVAARLLHCVRDTDTTARFAGDEFVVLLRGPLPADAVTAIRERIETEIAMPVHYGPHELSVGVSVGVSYAHPGDDPHATLKAADEAMYARKQERKRR
jgi:diguanylate cyclase (GGDEF)-like protein/PAS domain S-box-containing protein